jgi:putative phage-type endonuclease
MIPNLKYEHQRDINYSLLPDSLKKLMKIPQFAQRSSEWFAARKKCVTASVIDNILGRNPYSSREEILFKKSGLAVPFSGNKFTEHGCIFEDEAIAEYCRVFNKKTIDFGLLPHPTVDFLAGSPDGIAFENGRPDCRPIVLEVKCPYSRPIVSNKIPKQYFNQIILNSLITGYDSAFIEYIPQGHLGQDYRLNVIHLKLEDHKEHFETHNLPVLREFWDEVLHYRDVGIETHLNFEKWDRKCNPKKYKKKTLDFSSKKKPAVSMFVD